jgi:hypothetical protein
MATTLDIQTALANEARRQELKQKIARLQGQADATSSVINRLATVNGDTSIQLSEAVGQLAALDVGSGAGITADFGNKSTITQLLETERFAAKDATIDYIKANPACTEAEAAAAWDTAAVATHPYLPLTLQAAIPMGRLFQANLVKMNLIVENTWEAQRAWILANTKEVILGT